MESKTETGNSGYGKKIAAGLLLLFLIGIGYFILRRSTMAPMASSEGDELSKVVDKVFGDKSADSSTTIGGATNTGTNQVVFYRDCDFIGSSISLPVGSYDMQELINAGIPNDSVSSVMVPPWYRVILFADKGFTGKQLVLTKDTTCLKDNGFNDTMSSVKIEKIS